MPAWTALHGRLLRLLPTLPGWPRDVYDGPLVGDAPGRYATVGYRFDDENGGFYTLEQDRNACQVLETGEVRCELVIETGSDPAWLVRSRALALMGALEGSFREDPLLGVLGAASVARLVVDVVAWQTAGRAAVRIPFTVAYSTTT